MALKIGDKVKINLQGRRTHGMKGVIVSKNGHLYDVHLKGINKTFSYRHDSLIKTEPAKKVRMLDLDMYKHLDNVVVVSLTDNGKIDLKRVRRETLTRQMLEYQEVNKCEVIGIFDPHSFEFELSIDEIIALGEDPNDEPFWVWDAKETFKYQGGFDQDPNISCIDSQGMACSLKKEWIDWKKKLNHCWVLREANGKQVPKKAKIPNELTHKDIVDNLALPVEAKNIYANSNAGRNKLNFGVVYQKNGKLHVEHSGSAPCHYRMSSFDNRIGCKAAVHYFNKSYTHAMTKEQALQYLEYVVKDSPWSQHIITESVEDGLENGFFVRTDIPANAMMCTLYALRYPTEYPDKCLNMLECVDNGLSFAAAFFIAETNMLKNNTEGHHQLLSTYYMNRDHVKAFLNHEVGTTLTEGTYKKRGNYSKVSIHHGSSAVKVDDSFMEEFAHELDKLVIKKEDGKDAWGDVKFKRTLDFKNAVDYFNKLKG